MPIIQELSTLLSVDVPQLRKYIVTSPYRYKVYRIPKRNNKGVRIIAQPAKELKYLQRIVCDKYLSSLPVHSACTAYRKNISIKDNALEHVHNNYLLKMDFHDFFPSITPKDLIRHINSHLDWDDSDEDNLIIERLFFYSQERGTELKLSIGAPTSPFLSNTIMYGFDSKISEICKKEKISYTRYADDISFSTNRKNILFDFKDIVIKVLKDCEYPKIKINSDKTVFLSRKGNMHITGIVLSNDKKISLGRNKKRYIKSLVHRVVINNITDEERIYLSGFLSFCASIEPDFIERLKMKYGEETMSDLMGKKNG
jgi:retron-type reverse transcriptase